jgi:hypothetical protein
MSDVRIYTPKAQAITCCINCGYWRMGHERPPSPTHYLCMLTGDVIDDRFQSILPSCPLPKKEQADDKTVSR